MENASKALIIAGAILLSILIIGVGIFILTSAQGTIDSSLQSMSTQEVNSFNAQFTSYEGDEISGSNVKALLTNLAGNFSTYSDEPSKVPDVTLDTTTATYSNAEGSGSGSGIKYTKDISSMRNSIINKHTYSVEMEFGTNGVITKITIKDVTV